jgi:hypothetical protein
MTNVGKKNYFVSRQENFFSLHESFATKTPVLVTIQLPSTFDSSKYVGRVYSLRLSWSFFDALSKENPVNKNDITHPQVVEC